MMGVEGRDRGRLCPRRAAKLCRERTQNQAVVIGELLVLSQAEAPENSTTDGRVNFHASLFLLSRRLPLSECVELLPAENFKENYVFLDSSRKNRESSI